MSLLPPQTQNQRYPPDTGLKLTAFNGPDYFTSNVLQPRHQREARGQEGRGESALWSSLSPTAKATETVISDSPLPRDATLGGSRRYHDCKISMDMSGHENYEPSFTGQSGSTQPAVSPPTLASRPQALPPLSPLAKQPKLKIAGHPSPPLMSLRFGPAGF